MNFLITLTDKQLTRLNRQVWKRMTQYDGYQPFGYDAITLRLTKPEWCNALDTITNAYRVKTFIRHYIVAALWSSCAEDGTPLDSDYNPDDMSSDAMDRMTNDCISFMSKIGYISGDGAVKPLAKIDQIEQVAHDFWLTRNGHGAGFWDRPEVYGQEQSDQLTAIAKTFGECDLYAGDDDKIYVM